MSSEFYVGYYGTSYMVTSQHAFVKLTETYKKAPDFVPIQSGV
jgi:hypothetical protein